MWSSRHYLEEVILPVTGWTDQLVSVPRPFPAGDCVVAFDNDQIVQRKWKVEVGQVRSALEANRLSPSIKRGLKTFLHNKIDLLASQRKHPTSFVNSRCALRLKHDGIYKFSRTLLCIKGKFGTCVFYRRCLQIS